MTSLLVSLLAAFIHWAPCVTGVDSSMPLPVLNSPSAKGEYEECTLPMSPYVHNMACSPLCSFLTLVTKPSAAARTPHPPLPMQGPAEYIPKLQAHPRFPGTEESVLAPCVPGPLRELKPVP